MKMITIVSKAAERITFRFPEDALSRSYPGFIVSRWNEKLAYVATEDPELLEMVNRTLEAQKRIYRKREILLNAYLELCTPRPISPAYTVTASPDTITIAKLEGLHLDAKSLLDQVVAMNLQFLPQPIRDVESKPWPDENGTTGKYSLVETDYDGTRTVLDEGIGGEERSRLYRAAGEYYKSPPRRRSIMNLTIRKDSREPSIIERIRIADRLNQLGWTTTTITITKPE